MLSPIDNSEYVVRIYAGASGIDSALARAVRAQKAWQATPRGARINACRRMVDAFVANRERLAVELCWQMGRPIRCAHGEIDAFRRGGHDGVIAFGGGSGLDVGKAIALMAGQSLDLWDLEDVGDNWTRADARGIAPVVAVPTTAGTGSEVGRASVITDADRRVKKIIFHPKMLPSMVSLDPALTVGLPPGITAATGMDALFENLEALCSTSWHPMAEGIAVEGGRLVREYLPRAVADGGDIEARSQMQVASTMGATAFQKGLGAMHTLAHPLGALYDRHHGLLNAILMPYVLCANRVAIQARIERAARYLGLESPSFDGFLNWVLRLRRDLGIPHSLGEIGIDDGQLQRLGRMATQGPSACGNPIAFSAEQYGDICGRAILGDL